MSLTKVTYSMIQAAPINLSDYGVVGDGVADDTAAIQSAIGALALLDSGTLTGPANATYKITSTIDFSVLGELTNWYTLDFNGATFVWYGSQVGGDRMWYFYQNKSLTVKNFTLECNTTTSVSATVKGIFIDSLQPNGSGICSFSGFKIRLANIAMELGSYAASQNRVSDCKFEQFLIEGCTYGISTNSTNVDNILFSEGVLSGCYSGGFWLQRAGFIEIDSCTGYAADPFILISGPIGILNIISCQAENAPTFLYRKYYTDARIYPINFIGCSIDNNVWFDYDDAIGSDIQIVNFIGCYLREFICDAPDSIINMTSSVLATGGTMAIGGTNTKFYPVASKLLGTITYNVNGLQQPLYTNNLGVTYLNTSAGVQKGFLNVGASSVEIIGDAGVSVDLGSAGAINVKAKSNGALNYVPKSVTPGTPSAGDVYYDSVTNKLRCYNGSTWNDLF